MKLEFAPDCRVSNGKLLWSSEAIHARASRSLRSKYLTSVAALSVLGCNALLGIEEASLTCVGTTCDGGVMPRGNDLAPGPGTGASSASANSGSGSSAGVGVAHDAGALDASALGSVNGGELPGNVILPAPDGANTGGGDNSGSGSDNSGSGSDNSGSGSDNSGSGSDNSGSSDDDDDDESNGDNPGSGSSGPGSDPSGSGGSTAEPSPPSLCAGRAEGEAFCSGSTRISCGLGGSVARSLSCSSAEHCQQGTGASCAACLTGDARCEGELLTVCNATRSGFDSQRCASAPLCNAAALRCDPALCEPNENRCRGRNLERCNAARSALETVDCGSPQRCNAQAGRCDVCEPGTARCLNSRTIAACDASGAIETPIACGLLESCSAGACVVLGLPVR